MLTNSQRDDLVYRLQVIQRELKADGILTEIEIKASDRLGNPDFKMTLDGGHWKNSTASCELSSYDDSFFYSLEDDDGSVWYSSYTNC